MLSPHVTRAPTPLSRLSALGVAHTLTELQRLVPQGAGWQACEVDNLGHDPGRWPATLVRPAALVHAWLQEAKALGALTPRWNTAVHSLSCGATGDLANPTLWQARDAQGQCVGEAPTVVVAAAMGSVELLTGNSAPMALDDLPLNPVKGQMSLGVQLGAPLAARPQRNDGVFVPQYRDQGLPPDWPSSIWAMGSTFERGLANTQVTAEAHERNACSLETIHPVAAAGLRADLAQNRLLGWSQVRCASLDRLPVVGAAPDAQALRLQLEARRVLRRRVALADVPRWAGLHLICAMGSRGITLAPWCARQLALQINGEPTEVDPVLMAALDPARFAVKNARRQGAAQQPVTAG
jgi:tRNA 5-methylaminomethyl-2-thiouridine biosynthesis bifunctional protein